MKIKFSRQISEKYPNIKFHENPSIGILVVLCGRTNGRTDRHGEANSRLLQFCERAWELRRSCFLNESQANH